MKKTIEVGPNQTFLVKGPAKISIVKGEVSILGNILGKEESVVIVKGKALPIEATSETVLDVYMDNNDSLESLEEQFPKEWENMVNILEKVNVPTFIPILGSVDSGKTSLTTFLANSAYKKGFKVAIVDEDVGQSSIGQPCFVSMGLMERTVSTLSEVKLKGCYFVGSNTPSRLIHRTLTGVAMMVKKALDNNAEIVLIDTSGWVYGRGARELKTSLILMLQPKILIALQRENEIEHLLAPFNNSTINIIRLPAPKTYKRNRESRKFLREILYQKGLENGKEITLNFDQVSLKYTLLGSGTKVKQEKFEEIKRILGCLPLYIEESADILYIVLPDGEVRINKELAEYLENHFGKTEVYFTQKSDFENVLVAFQDKYNEPIGIGIIKKIDFEKREITFYTPIDKEKIQSIQFGLLKVSQDGEEIGYTKIL